ncbi:putative bifunctional diguanylate cyclase/phosphodiesterase [Hoeflea olei]|uniref:putative bifunctional diguanylate cyclase/phosphodiesterase n=1 Tax=Hoeflea olei TaxID=1480615 RepID=UPI001FD876D1|nr:EAL domain-containing protein [Hoeflea olei]
MLKAQYEVFSRQVPLMYSIVLVNAWALALNFIPVAPAWLTIYLPVGFTLICGARLWGWWRSRGVVPTARMARRALTLTNLFAVALTVTLTGWALALYPYGDPYLQGNIAFFIGISGLGVIICLQQLRSAAFIAAIVINLMFFVYFSLSGIASFASMAGNLLLVSIALLMVVTVQFRHFAGAVQARRKVEAVGRENFRLANLDSLTGLPNRRSFFSHLDEVFAATGTRRLAVGIIDLDGFKPVNDLYGHKLGDTLLVQVGHRLSGLMKQNCHLARLGGDEFALVIADCPPDAELLAFGEKICMALRDPFVLPEATLQLAGTIGFAVYPELAVGAEELYESADYALYQAKRTTRGHSMLFSQSHVKAIQREKQIEQALRQADLEAEIAVYFQPIVDIGSDRTVAFEALARWTSPTLGSVPPGQFIPVAERIGLIGQLTRVLLRKALASAGAWPGEVGLSFNLSTHDISSSESAIALAGIIMASGIDPRRLDFEITETAMMYDFAQAKSAINMLKTMGCGIALDDFGTGYSSLSQLHALPLTKIKIDRSFVTELHKNPASLKIVKSLLALSSDMGLRCVTEGVETEEELAALRQLGGKLVQGYLFSRPISETDATEYLLQDGAAETAARIASGGA